MVNEVTVVRVYLTEGDKLLKLVMGYLHDEIQVKGVTVFRAISGFGASGVMLSSDLLTMSMDLPLVVEFFDEPTKVAKAIDHLATIVKPGHIISWQANA